MVLIAVAIVLILAVRSWLAVAPTAVQILNPAAVDARGAKKPKGPRPVIPDHGDPKAAASLANLPDLQDMKSETDKHAREVKQALEDADH